jgi:hypothetical protein
MTYVNTTFSFLPFQATDSSSILVYSMTQSSSSSLPSYRNALSLTLCVDGVVPAVDLTSSNSYLSVSTSDGSNRGCQCGNSLQGPGQYAAQVCPAATTAAAKSSQGSMNKSNIATSTASRRMKWQWEWEWQLSHIFQEPAAILTLAVALALHL